MAVTQFNSSYDIDYEEILDFKIIWIPNGETNLLIDEKSIKIGIKDFVILMPKHQVIFEQNPLININIVSFSVDYLQLEAKPLSIDLFKLFIKSSANKISKIKIVDVKQIQNLLKMILLSDDKKPIDQQICINLINTILLLIIKNKHDFVSTPDKYFARIHDFFLSVFKNSKIEKRVNFYANQLSISSKRLNQILQDYTGHSASYFIQEHTIMQAKHLILTSKMNINEIATELGFKDVAYFSRFFKRWMGLSPEKFRNITE